MVEIVKEEENDREGHRTVILALVGLSFAGLFGIAVVDVASQQNLQLSMYYLLISFLCCLSALNLQSYKYRRWHDQVGDVLVDAATLSLVLSVIAIVLSTNPSNLYKLAITTVALLGWGVDHTIRLLLMYRFLHLKRDVDNEQ